MRAQSIFLSFTAIFWIGIGYYFVRCSHGDAPIAPTGKSGAPTKPAATRLPVVTSAELVQHRTTQDCWIVLNGVVYDASAYLSEHPGKKREIDSFCGKDGTQGWDAKPSGTEKDESHSVKANQLLAQLPRVGIMKRRDD